MIMRRLAGAFGSLILIAGVSACGSSSSKDTQTSTKTTYTWDKDVAPIIAATCASSGCHGATPGPLAKTYLDNQANFKTDKSLVIADLTSGTMPQTGTISATNKQILIDFENQ